MNKFLIGAVAAVFTCSTPAFADWTPRQATIIRAANEVVEAGSWAYTNMCKVPNGKARFDAGQNRLKQMRPVMAKELGDYAVYEIFVLRAPVYGPNARPPETCKPLKQYSGEKEQVMQRYERAIESLDAALKAQEQGT